MRRLRTARKENQRPTKDFSDIPLETEEDVMESLKSALSSNDALNELHALEELGGEAVHLDVPRVQELLKVTYSIRQLERPAKLPAYLLNEDVLSFEAELRFGLSTQEMLKKLHHVQHVFTSLHGGETFGDVDNFLRSKKCKATLITFEDPDANQRVPGPKLFFGRKKQILTRTESVVLSDCCSLEKALVLLLCIYYVKDLDYPQAFGQTLGLLQTVLVKESPFQHYLQTQRLSEILKAL